MKSLKWGNGVVRWVFFRDIFGGRMENGLRERDWSRRILLWLGEMGGGWIGVVLEGMERRGGIRGVFGELLGFDERLVWEVMKGLFLFLVE